VITATIVDPQPTAARSGAAGTVRAMRMAAAVLGGVTVMLLGAGCGGSDEEPVATVDDPISAAASVRAASASTSEITSYRLSMVFSLEETGDACIDRLAGLVPDAELALTSDHDDLRIEVTDPESGATGRLVGGTAYVEASGLPDHSSPTPWVSIDEQAWASFGGPDLSAFSWLDVATGEEDELTALGFEEILDSFEVDGLEATEVGPDEVRGQPTTHYRVDVDADAAAQVGFDSSSVDVWVGDDGVVRRLRTTTDPADDEEAPTSPEDESALEVPALTVTIEIWDVGADIPIDAPPAAEVTPLSALEAPSDLDSFLPPGLMEDCLTSFGE
jgi:hypothetical protein